MTEVPQRRGSNKLFFWARVGCTLFLAALILSRVDVSRVVSAFSSSKPVFFWAATVAFSWTWFFNAGSGHFLFRSMKIRMAPLQVLKYNLFSAFFSIVGDWAGAFTRWASFAWVSKRPNRAFAWMVLERYIAFVANFVVYLAVFAWRGGYGFGKTEFRIAWAASLLGALGLAVCGIAVASERVARVADGLVGRFLRTGKSSGFQALREDLAAGKRDLVRVFILNLGTVGVGALGLDLLFASAGVHLGWTETVWVATLASVAQSIPLTLLGLGLREGSLIYLLSKDGVPKETAVALGLLWFAIAFLFGWLGGAWFLIDSMRKRRTGINSGSSL